MKDVLLLSLPFGALERQAIGLSLLKSALVRDGVGCDVAYPCFDFADIVGYETYRWVSSDFPHTAFVGEWLFTPSLYGDRPEVDRRYAEEVLRQTWQVPDDQVRQLFALRPAVNRFMDHCLAALPWRDYPIVGFTSTFEQNVASLALARRIKEASPETSIVFGGANWEGEMGVALHRLFPFVDYVCSGEADQSFPALVSALLRDGGAGVRSIPGVVYREGGVTVATGPPDLVREMDALPIPDYADYFDALAQSAAGVSVVPHLLLETSRGCWWGAKSHCTFCGLNGGAMSFRSKSADRALAELVELVDRWGIDYVEVVDNILDMRYLRDFLPALADLDREVRLFYEVKANLTRDQVALLKRAGVDRIQPGIESLSDRVLGLMNKGTTGLQNVQLLKWCREAGITVDWNLLYGFPGERAEDYEATMALLPDIRFLQPPGGQGPVRLDRFSPYYTDPDGYGLTNVRPMAPYRFLYPAGDDALRQIAYYFDYDYAPGMDPAGAAAPAVAYAADWLRAPESGALTAVAQNGTLTLLDTRPSAVRPEVRLDGIEREAYEFCDEARTPASVARRLARDYPDAAIDEAGVVGFLDSLVANKLMLTDGVRYLSLALRTPAGA